MSALAASFGLGGHPDHPLRDAFLKWQCRVRQIAMRENQGRPDDAIMPDVVLAGEHAPMGAIITVLNKAPGFAQTAELNHMSAKTNDPAQRRDQAIQFLSATYYQKHREFSDILTATFPANSEGAAKIRRAEKCLLRFDAFNQQFELTCKVWRLTHRNPLCQATIAHNRLFNPTLPIDSVVLGFEPDWGESKAQPELGQR